MTKKQFHTAAAVLFAFFAAAAVTMMWIGGGVSFSDFLQTGDVYDFSQEALTSSAKGFEWDGEDGCFVITKEKAQKKFVINGKEAGWGILYIDADSIRMPQMQIQIQYYGRDKSLLYTQQAALVNGENKILLQPDIAMYRLGFVIADARGETVSFRSMQVREKEAPVAGAEAIGVFAVSFAVFLFAVLFFVFRKKRKIRREEGALACYIYGSLCRGIGRLLGSRRAADGRWKYLRILFTMLFFVSIAGNVTGFSTDQTFFRYHYLICAGLLLLAGFFCWERPLSAVSLRSPTACAWIMLWVFLMISDFFAGANVHFHAYVMVAAGGFFIFMWQQMEHADRLYDVAMDALKITFYISAIVCFLFRPKLLAVQYNGIFRNAPECAMFALLMFLTFFIGIDQAVEKKEERRRYLFWDVTGAALSFYFVLRAEQMAGYILAAVALALMFARMVFLRHEYQSFLKKHAAALFFSVLTAVIISGIFHFGIRTIPQATGIVLSYEGEEKISGKDMSVIEEIRRALPQEAEGLVAKEEINSGPVTKTYLRRLNAFGNTDRVKVSRKEVKTQWGYLAFAYRYGIFALFLLCLYVLSVLWTGAPGFWKDRKKLWIFFTALVYAVFQAVSSADLPLAHPLWLCFFLGTGYWFADEKN